MNAQGLTAANGVDEPKLMKIIRLCEELYIDAIGICETWFKSKQTKIDDEMNLILTRVAPGWQWFGNKRKIQSSYAKRGSGGVGLLIRKGAGKVEIRYVGCDGVLHARVDDLDIIVLYLVPKQKKDSQRLAHNDRIWDLLDAIIPKILDDDRKLAILADGNGRFGELPSVTSSLNALRLDTDEGFEDVVDEIEKPYTRTSADKEVNKEGRELLDALNANNMVVLNGINNVEMDYSFVGHRGFSTVDFIAVSENLVLPDSHTRVCEDSATDLGTDHRVIWAEVKMKTAAKVEKELETASIRAMGFKQTKLSSTECKREMRKIGEVEAKAFVEWVTNETSRIGDAQVIVTR